MRKSPIVICHVLHSFDKIGGLENGVVNLVNNLPESVFIHVICALTEVGEIRDRVSCQNIRYCSLKKPDRNDITIPFKLSSSFRKEHADVVHMRNWGTMLEGYVAARMAGVEKVVYSEHGRHYDDLEENKRMKTMIKKYIFNHVDSMVCVSPELRDEMSKLYGIRRDITVIVNGVDTNRFRPGADSTLRQELGLAETDFIVGTVGRLAKGKGFDQLARAILEVDLPWHLVIVGEGPERQLLESIISQAEGGLRVHLLGARDDIPKILRGFDIFALPSFSEGLSNVILEAMASALPVVAYDVGGNPQLVAQDKGGYLLPKGDINSMIDSIKSLANCTSRISDMGRYNRDKVLNCYSMKAMANAYQQLYGAGDTSKLNTTNSETGK